MVRAIAGTLLALGRGELDLDAIGEAIESGEQTGSRRDSARVRINLAFSALSD